MCSVVPRCAPLCHAVLRCASLCPAVSRCATLCPAVPRCAALCPAVPRCDSLCPAVPRHRGKPPLRNVDDVLQKSKIGDEAFRDRITRIRTTFANPHSTSILFSTTIYAQVKFTRAEMPYKSTAQKIQWQNEQRRKHCRRRMEERKKG